MTVSVCFKCGSEKAGPFSTCEKCGATPHMVSERVLSLVLCEYLASSLQLVHFAHEIKIGLRLSAPISLIDQAKAALKDPQMMAKLGLRHEDMSATVKSFAQQIGVTPDRLITQLVAAGIVGKVADDVLSDDEKMALLCYLRSQHGAAGAGTTRITLKKTSVSQMRNATRTGPAHGASTRDPQPPVAPTGDTQRPIASRQPLPSASKTTRTAKETSLHRNPFRVLGVTTRDDRRRIVELAEERALELDHDVCQKARSDLTNPRTRLGAELAWLPGVSPKKAEQLTDIFLQKPLSIRTESGLPVLAHANLMAAAFEAIDTESDPYDVAGFIQEMAVLVDDLSVDQIMRDINEDRAVAGFPEVRSADQIEAELDERKRHFRKAMKDALNRLPTTSLIEAMTLAVEKVTSSGEDHAPELIDELVDSYEVEAQGFLQAEAENVHKLIKAVRGSADAGESAIGPLIEQLEGVARNWDKVAQPVQLSAKARGIDHGPSNEIAHAIRSLGVDLFNKYKMLTQSKRITNLLQELFAELPQVSEQVGQDANTLEEIFRNHEQAESRKNEWAREVTYRAEIGMIFKNTLSISPEGVAWKDRHYPLEAITRVRWGGVRQSVNGVPTGTTFTIGFGDNLSEAVVETSKKEVFDSFIEKLWRAAGVRLLTELIEALRAGEEIRIGEITVRDDGVTLFRNKFLTANEPVRCSWSQVQVWSADGAFCIGMKDDKNTSASFSYIATTNTHIFEQAVRMAFKKPGMHRLSDLLQES